MNWNILMPYITVISTIAAIISMFIAYYLSKQIGVENIKNENNKLKNRLGKLEKFKNKILYSKIVNIDISFPSLEDELLLNNIEKDISKPESDIDYFLLGLDKMMDYKRESEEDEQNGGNLDDARKHFKDAIKNVIGSNLFASEYYNYLGVSFAWQKKFDAAIDYYEKSIKSNPQNYKPYYNLACSYSKKIKFSDNLTDKETHSFQEKIKVNLEKALKLRPEEYKTVLKDKDFSVVKNQSFFAEYVNEAAENYHSCKSYASSILNSKN